MFTCLAKNITTLTALLLFAVSVQTVASEAVWIDVRTPEEFKAGHRDGAHNIPYEQIGQRISELKLDKDSKIYLYCRSGRRSGIATSTLKSLGFTAVKNIGGLNDALEYQTPE